MPIKAIHIVPTANMLEVDRRHNKGLNMLLTHKVLEDRNYRDTARQLGGTKYLDNSFFELGYSLSPKEMLQAAELCGANVMICPDGTYNGMKEFKANGMGVMTIPKDPRQFIDMMYDPDVDYVGLSEEHIDYRHSPGARYELLRDHVRDDMPKKKIHLLGGTDSIWELGMLHPFRQYIYSWDSSAAIWQGHLGHKLWDMPRKDTTSVDFDAKVDINDPLIKKNIEFVNKLLKGVM